jgi:RNA ligase (TIGR02306 family)
MYSNSERKMAWVAKIDEIKPIENADLIVAYRVGGWWVVDKKKAYTVGDLVIYASIDSWIPNSIAPFLSKGKEPRLYEGILGERLKTIRLKGTLSQGLLLPSQTVADKVDNITENMDVSGLLGIVKWEAPIPAHLVGEIKGNFPSSIPKTYQERIQNLKEELDYWKHNNYTFSVEEKLDGSSMTVYLMDGEFGVCSRNLDLTRDENNSFWKTAIHLDFENIMREMGLEYAIQGELVGERIQHNIYKIKGQKFYIFDVYDIKNGNYLTPTKRLKFVRDLSEKNPEIESVPILFIEHQLTGTIDELLEYSNCKSKLNPSVDQEGFVYKCNQDPNISFKVISNNFLLKAENSEAHRPNNSKSN